jgi:hypothetical protein
LNHGRKFRNEKRAPKLETFFEAQFSTKVKNKNKNKNKNKTQFLGTKRDLNEDIEKL